MHSVEESKIAPFFGISLEEMALPCALRLLPFSSCPALHLLFECKDAHTEPFLESQSVKAREHLLYDGLAYSLWSQNHSLCKAWRNPRNLLQPSHFFDKEVET